ncbi:MAG: hypothetical protein LUI07_10510 [Lachnospiraceae bacterium]|nr:hypothetical protein [Lachnospiraceae bacterium]
MENENNTAEESCIQFLRKQEEKQNKKQKEKQKESDTPESSEWSDSLYSGNICLANDCTGLMPTPPASEAEMEAYEEMYPSFLTHEAAPGRDESK